MAGGGLKWDLSSIVAMRLDVRVIEGFGPVSFTTATHVINLHAAVGITLKVPGHRTEPKAEPAPPPIPEPTPAPASEPVRPAEVAPAPPPAPEAVDSDGDQVPDDDDACPYVPGLTQAQGC
jgi:hypothetical protein